MSFSCTCRYLRTLLCIVLAAHGFAAHAATRYWVAGSGDWTDAANHWSNANGGSPGAGYLPGAGDDAVFNANSGGGTCTFNTSTTITSINLSGYTGTFDFGADHVLTVSGVVDLRSSGSITAGTGTSGITLTNTGGKNFNPHGSSSLLNVIKQGTATTTVQNNPLNSTTLTISSGTLTLNAVVNVITLTIDGGSLNMGGVQTHTATTVATSGGTVNFNNATLQVSADVNFGSLADIQRSNNNGTLELTGTAPATQAFTLWPAGTAYPNVRQSGTSTTNATGVLRARSITVDAGALATSSTVSASDLTINGGTFSPGGRMVLSGDVTMNGGTLNLGNGSYQDSVAQLSNSSSGGTINFGNSTLWFLNRYAYFANTAVTSASGSKIIFARASGGRTDFVPNSSGAATYPDIEIRTAGQTCYFTTNAATVGDVLLVDGSWNVGIALTAGDIALQGGGTTTFSSTISATTLTVSSGACNTSAAVTLSGALTVNGGSIDLNDNASTHSTTALTASSGTIDFGTSTIRITSGNADLSGSATITAGTGTIEFYGGSGVQVFTAKDGSTTHPKLAHSQGSRVQLDGANPIIVNGFSNTAGSIDFNGSGVTTANGGDFSITLGTTSTIYNNSIGGRTVTVAGAATFNGQSGNLLNVNPGSGWTITATGTLVANYATIANSDASGGSRGIALNSTNGGGNLNWFIGRKWSSIGSTDWHVDANWSGGSKPGLGEAAIFDNSSAINCNLTADASVAAIVFQSTYTHTFNFQSGNMTVSGDAYLDGGETVTASSGRITFSGGSSVVQTFTPKNGQTHPNITHSGAGRVKLATRDLTCLSYTNSGGAIDLNGRNITVTPGDFSVTGGTSSTFYAPGGVNCLGGRTIRVTAGSASFNGQTGNVLDMDPSSSWTCRIDAGTLTADYATIANSDASLGVTGIPTTNCVNGGGNTNWRFDVTWDGGGGDNLWSTDANWTDDQVPPAGSNVIFDGSLGANSRKACTFDATISLNRIVFTSGYTGAFSFGTGAMTITDSANFATGGTIDAGTTGALILAKPSHGTMNFVPKTGQTFPDISLGTNVVVNVAGASLSAKSIAQSVNGSDWYWGSEGRTHTVVNDLTVSNGDMFFGNSTVTVTTGNATFTGCDNVDYGTTSTLEFSAGAGVTQVFTPRNGTDDHPLLKHSGLGTLQLGGDVEVLGFLQTAGTMDFGGNNLTTVNAGDFTISNGVAGSVTGLTTNLITVAGNASLNGTEGNRMVLTSAGVYRINATGSLTADYVAIDHCNATGSTGYADHSLDNAGPNTNWVFIRRWDGGGGDDHWNTAGNWLEDQVPASTDSVIFDATGSTHNVTLTSSPTVRGILMTSGYSGTFDFADQTLTVNGVPSFNSNGALAYTTGSLHLAATSGTLPFTPRQGEEFPDITKDGAGTYTVTTHGLTAKSVASSAGTWDWGDDGFVNTLQSLTRSGGGMDFGTATVTVTTGNATLNGGGTITAGSGTLEFTAASGTQILTPLGGATHPNIVHSAAGMLRLGGTIICLSFYQSSGIIHFNASNVTTTGDFTIDNGMPTTIYAPGGLNSLRGITITVPGDAQFNGTSPDAAERLNLNPDLTWTVHVTRGSVLEATYADLQNSNAGAAGTWQTGVLVDGNWIDPNTNWKTAVVWTGAVNSNWDLDGNWEGGAKPVAGDPVKFSGTYNNDCQLDVDPPTISSLTFTSDYTANFNFSTHTLKTTGDVNFSTGVHITAGSGTLEFARTANGRQYFTPKSGEAFPNIKKSGNKNIYVATTVPLTAKALTIAASAGNTWYWGSGGLTHTVESISQAAGTMDFGTSIVKATTGDVLFTGGGITTGTGTLEFTASSGTQVFRPRASGTAHPNIVHSGAATLQFSTNNVRALSFSQSAGILDFNGMDVTTTSSGNFSITNGTSSTIATPGGVSSLTGRTITVAGNCLVEGSSGSYINLRTSADHFFTVTGSLYAHYADLEHSNALGGSKGFAVPANDYSNNQNWEFGMYWSRPAASGAGNWSDGANWSTASPPGPEDPVQFKAGAYADCNLDIDDSVASVTMSGYTGTFDFTTHLLGIKSNSDFTNSGDIKPSAGRLVVHTNSVSITPPSGDTLPSVWMTTNAKTLTIAGRGIVTKGELRNTATSTIDLGDNGYTNYMDSLNIVSGTIDFGTSTVRVSGNVDFSTASAVNCTGNSGTLEFTGGVSTTQTIKPRNAATALVYSHTGAGTLKLATYQLRGYNFTQSAGTFDFNGLNVNMTNDFTVTNGKSSSFSNLAGRTITATHNISLGGAAGDSIGLDPASSWNASAGNLLTAAYGVLKYSNATNKKGQGTFCRNAGSNINWDFSTPEQPTVVWSRVGVGAMSGGAIGNDKAFLGTADTLRAINLSDNGNDDWKYATTSYGNCQQPTLIYTGGHYTVLAAAGNGIIGLEDGSGAPTELFVKDVGAVAGNPYASPDGLSFYVVYGTSVSKRLLADGTETWNKTLANASYAADPVVYSTNVYVATTTGVVQKYDADGTPLQTYSCGFSVTLPLLIQNSVLYLTPATSKLYAINTSDMSEKWSSPVSLYSTNSAPAFKDNLSSDIFVGASTRVQKVTDNGSSGSVTWSYDAGATVASIAVAYGGVVYFGRNNGQYCAVRASDKTVVGKWPYYAAAGDASGGPMIDLTYGRVVFGTNAGDIHCFAKETP